MVKNIAFAAFLAQIALVSALITQTVLFASSASQAASSQPAVTPVPAIATDEECAKATWPDIPKHCLLRVEARKHITMIALTPAK
ncbi:hypothetical protein [Mesorhizobium loti]|uniref:Porin n=1 Tax=Mesorhizobium loti R88b TaxID=935548 RepID=A0A6M7WQD5_RHILI|nr:hypothetical protein [Mesorhizobium loti]QKD04277.1 hypothetical protein EB235_24650 [Mesorhizobium loti R88b]